MIFILYTQYYHHREEEEKRIEKEGQVVISKHCRILTELMVHDGNDQGSNFTFLTTLIYIRAHDV